MDVEMSHLNFRKEVLFSRKCRVLWLMDLNVYAVIFFLVGNITIECKDNYLDMDLQTLYNTN
jgi:hypothetical protein